VARVLLISADTVGPRMAGPGIRYWEFARSLAGDADVVLAIPNAPTVPGEGFRVERYTSRGLWRLVRDADVVVCQGFRFPLALLQLTRRVVVVDLYDPLPLELLEYYRDATRRDARFAQQRIALRLDRLCRLGDVFLCAGLRQRDLWLGALALAGRLNWDTYREDPRLDRLVAMAPFGLPSIPPRRTGAAFRGRWPALRDSDRLLLWGGGMWDWLDPLTVIRAIGRVAAKRDDVKLVFMGLQHPNTRIGAMRIHEEAVSLARSLDLHERHVFFNYGWLPYDERQNALLEADVGISAHLDRAEAHFAFRTRLLDYLWAGLPILCTRGDDLADTVRARGAGIVLEPSDVEGWAEAILRLVDDGELAARCRARATDLAQELVWERVTAPLRAVCRDPRPAPDRARRSRVADWWGLAVYGVQFTVLVARYGSWRRIWQWFRSR
jgi:glycosyltransferase involved in cell wall biosynthesis